MDVLEQFALEVATQTAALIADGDLNLHPMMRVREQTSVQTMVTLWEHFGGWD